MTSSNACWYFCPEKRPLCFYFLTIFIHSYARLLPLVLTNEWILIHIEYISAIVMGHIHINTNIFSSIKLTKGVERYSNTKQVRIGLQKGMKRIDSHFFHTDFLLLNVGCVAAKHHLLFDVMNSYPEKRLFHNSFTFTYCPKEFNIQLNSCARFSLLLSLSLSLSISCDSLFQMIQELFSPRAWSEISPHQHIHK